MLAELEVISMINNNKAILIQRVARGNTVAPSVPNGGRGFLMSPPCLEAQGYQFDPTFL